MERRTEGARRRGMPVGRGSGRHRGTVERDGRGAVCDGRGDAQRRPQAGLARHPRGVDAQLDHLGRVGGHEHGHAHVGKQALGGRRDGRRLGEGIVADDGHGTAGGRRAGPIRVAQSIDRPVEARGLAVPVADDAVDALAQRARPGRELGAGHRRGTQFLVDGRQVDDVQRLQQIRAAGELQVVSAQRGTLVAGDERRGLQSARAVGKCAVAHGAHQGLDARQVHGALVGGQALGDDVAALPRDPRPVGVFGRGVGSERGRQHRGHVGSPVHVSRSRVRGNELATGVW